MAARKPSSWVNFQDFLGVNRDSGQAMAQRVSGNVGEKAQGARDALGSAASDVQRATSRAGQGPVQASSSADAAIGAQKATYSGPESLDAANTGLAAQIADAQSRVARAGTAGGQAQLLGETYGKSRGPATVGGGALDSALLSGVGGVQGLQTQFGKLGDEYATAQKTAAGQVAGGRAAAKAQQTQWDALRQKLAGEEAARGDAAQQANDNAAFEAKWAAAQGSNTIDEVNRAFGSLNSIMSPITQVAENTGNRDPIADWGRQLIDPNAGKASGATRGQKIWWQPQHKAVYRQMDPAQWQELNSLPPQAQQGWLEQRRREIETGQPHQRYDATRNFGTDPHKYL